MDAEFGGRQLKDQPAVGRVVALDGIPAKHAAQCLAQPLSLARVEEDVRADNPHAVMLRASAWRALRQGRLRLLADDPLAPIHKLVSHLGAERTDGLSRRPGRGIPSTRVIERTTESVGGHSRTVSVLGGPVWGSLSGWRRCSLFVTQFPNDLACGCLSSDLSEQRGRCRPGARLLA